MKDEAELVPEVAARVAPESCNLLQTSEIWNGRSVCAAPLPMLGLLLSGSSEWMRTMEL